jgi:molecular chaperone GrpE
MVGIMKKDKKNVQGSKATEKNKLSGTTESGSGTPDREVKELTETLKRVQADFENYRKQVEKRIEEMKQVASKDIIVKLLPILDNFELAIKNKESEEEFCKGVELIYAQIFSILEEEGLEQIKTEGEVFDPYKHEALIKEESDLPENTIVEVLQKGYELNDKVIRHAKVKLSKGTEKAELSGTTEGGKEVKNDNQKNS